MNIKNQKIDETEAKKILLEKNQARVKRCLEKIEKALMEENCSLQMTMLITQQGTMPQITIIANQ